MRKFMSIVVALALVAGFATGAAGAAAEEGPAGAEEASPSSPANEAAPLAGCPGGIVCVYTGFEFTGAEGDTPCSQTGIHPLAGNERSAANGCSNRAVFLRYEGVFTGICLPAQTSDGNILFNEIRIGEPSSHC